MRARNFGRLSGFSLWKLYAISRELQEIYQSNPLRSRAFGGKGEEPSASANSNYRSSELGKSFSEAEAGRILADGLKHSDLNEGSLKRTAKGDWRKVAIAWTISERTTVQQSKP